MITHSLSPLRPRGFDLRVVSRLLLLTALAAGVRPAQPQQGADLSAPSAQIPSSPSSKQPSQIDIQYTGRLFGYYRVEPDIKLDDLPRAYDEDV